MKCSRPVSLSRKAVDQEKTLIRIILAGNSGGE
jgi:hypothetical protein